MADQNPLDVSAGKGEQERASASAAGGRPEDADRPAASPDPTRTAAPIGGTSPRTRLLVSLVIIAGIVGLLLFAAMSGGDDSSAGTTGGTASGQSASGGSNSKGSESDGSGDASESQQSYSEDEIREALSPLIRRDPDDVAALGDVDAPVVMVAYSDFLCPYCGRWARDTQPTLVDKYVNSGLLRIEWRDLPVIGGDDSVRASVATRAAGKQGAYWEFHDALFADPGGNTAATVSEEALVQTARDLGLDAERFRADLADPALTRAVNADYSEGAGIGITSTPTFIINGLPLMGAMPTSTFVEVIDKELARAGTAASDSSPSTGS